MQRKEGRWGGEGGVKEKEKEKRGDVKKITNDVEIEHGRNAAEWSNDDRSALSGATPRFPQLFLALISWRSPLSLLHASIVHPPASTEDKRTVCSHPFYFALQFTSDSSPLSYRTLTITFLSFTRPSLLFFVKQNSLAPKSNPYNLCWDHPPACHRPYLPVPQSNLRLWGARHALPSHLLPKPSFSTRAPPHLQLLEKRVRPRSSYSYFPRTISLSPPLPSSTRPASAHAPTPN